MQRLRHLQPGNPARHVGDRRRAGPADAASATADLPPRAAAATADGSAPEGFEIKGNADSGLYHVPGSAFYNRTVAEFWFATAEDAEAAGFQLPPSQRTAADSADGDKD